MAAISQIRIPAVLRRHRNADLYVAVANYQLLLAARTGQHVGMHEALYEYVRQFSWRARLARAWRSTLSRLRTDTVG